MGGIKSRLLMMVSVNLICLPIFLVGDIFKYTG